MFTPVVNVLFFQKEIKPLYAISVHCGSYLKDLCTPYITSLRFPKSIKLLKAVIRHLPITSEDITAALHEFGFDVISAKQIAENSPHLRDQ
jgi:hypothetical protein